MRQLSGLCVLVGTLLSHHLALAQSASANLHFETDPRGLVVWVSEPSPLSDPTRPVHYLRLCEAPCARPLPLGNYRVALSTGSDAPIASYSRLSLQSETWLKGRLESRRGIRTVGYGVLGVGLGAGATLITLALAGGPFHDARTTLGVLGIVTASTGVSLGLPLLLISDTAIVVSVGSPKAANTISAIGLARRF